MPKLNRIFQGDRAIWIVFFFLCIISLVEVFSAGSTLTFKSGQFWAPLQKQAMFLGLGTLVVLAVHNIPCRFFKAVPTVLWPGSALLLFLAMTTGHATNDANRWFEVAGIQFQPSEFGKGAVVIIVALILSFLQGKDGADRRAFKLILGFTLPICLLIFAENISTALLLFGVVVLMMFIGRVPMSQMGKLFGVLAIGGIVGVMTLFSLPDDPHATIYQQPGFKRVLTAKNRLTKHLAQKAEVAPEDFDLMDKDAQVGHAHIAIASSRGVGLMPGNSVERDYLSQAYSDFIYAIIIEETGLWGAFIVIFLYAVILVRAGRIASRCERNFPAFLVLGLALLMVSQALLNMLVAVGLFPVTGQPLPLISRGGTSTLINCAYIGMILSVSRYARKADQPLPADDEDGDIVREFYSDENLA